MIMSIPCHKSTRPRPLRTPSLFSFSGRRVAVVATLMIIVLVAMGAQHNYSAVSKTRSDYYPDNSSFTRRTNVAIRQEANRNSSNATAPVLNDPPLPRKLVVSPSDAVILHLGKAGGGTLMERTREQWKLHFRQCHPRPCGYRFHNNINNNNAANGNSSTTSTTQWQPHILLTLRDPVERFVSAFYWRVMEICEPAGGGDGGGGKGNVSATTDSDLHHRYHQQQRAQQQQQQRRRRRLLMNRGMHQRQRQRPRPQRNKCHYQGDRIVDQKYQRNVNHLAREMCEAATKNNSDSNSIPGRVMALPWETLLRYFVHAQDSLADWLDFEWNAERLFPIVLEQSGVGNSSSSPLSLEDQIDASIVWIQNEIRLEPEAAFAIRQSHALQSAGTNNKLHTTKGLLQQQYELEPELETCLARYYFRSDYELLQKIKEMACKTATCRLGIQSILDRRLPLLQESLTEN